MKALVLKAAQMRLCKFPHSCSELLLENVKLPYLYPIAPPLSLGTLLTQRFQCVLVTQLLVIWKVYF